MSEQKPAELTAQNYIDRLVESLKSVETKVRALHDDRLYSDIWLGAPQLDSQDLAYLVRLLWTKLESFDWSGVKETNLFSDLAGKASKLDGSDLNGMLYGSQFGASGFVAFLSSLEAQLGAQLGESEIKGLLAIPTGLNRNLQAAKQRISQIELETKDLSSKIGSINSAFEASERLQFAQSDVDAALINARSSQDIIKKIEVELDITKDEAIKKLAEIQKIMDFAQLSLGKADQAYSAATSQGLAKSFSNRANSLSRSIYIWMLSLVVSLIAGGYIGYLRFPEILKSIGAQPEWGGVAANVLLGCMGLAPAVWLAWVSTKQIGQRFKLAEDYGYKAALATAYEGYRAEAAHIDPLFQAQLFAIALGRLDEIPLRVMDSSVAGSPLHELLQSPEFKVAIEKVPSLKDKVINLMRPSKESPLAPESQKAAVE